MDSFVIIPKGAFMSNEFWALDAKVIVIKMYPWQRKKTTG